MILDAPDDRSGELTLVFELEAARALADPAAAFADASEWSRYVGVVGNDTGAVAQFVREHDLRQDYALGDRDKWLAMQDVREATDTPRHVFVGASPEDQRIARHLDWEFLTAPEAAEKAGWRLSADTHAGADGTRADGDEGLADRVRERLDDSDLWPF